MNYGEPLRKDHEELLRQKKVCVSSVVKCLSERLRLGWVLLHHSLAKQRDVGLHSINPQSEVSNFLVRKDSQIQFPTKKGENFRYSHHSGNQRQAWMLYNIPHTAYIVIYM